ncbi:nucleotidyltransferase family protein [Sulfurovum sp. AR]|uniref:nucleotidyltransferase domain-containing protein n=1 Tax=Sulfurovum sp. AR TaxID=1165841 RepID=UPI00025C47B5|nr:nucleotidyltransferase family protein [Sulfurovum sp. AR]EIF51213.1 hypothetical protein SULAR_04963 [Sulfurovum sp. AR]
MSIKHKNPQLNDELLFLIACCQIDPSEDDINFIFSYLNAEELELNTLISLANQHGILPLIYKTIKHLSHPELNSDTLVIKMKEGCSDNLNAQRSTLNTEILTELKAHYMSISHRNMLMSAELIRIMKLLKENNIEALAFKGPVLSQMAYGDITLRQYADLDVLTRKEDIYKIDTLLKEEGYQRLLDITPTQEKVYIQYAHDIGFIHPNKSVHFEMHWSLLDKDYPMQVDLEDFWKETQEVKLNSYPIDTFSNENLLIYLCIHGSKHLWERIEWIKDIDLLIRKNEINWAKVIEKSKGTGFEKMIFLGFSLCTTLFATPLPPVIQEQIKKYQQLDILSDVVLESWQTPKSTFQKTKTRLKLFPGIKEQLLYLHKIILKPSFNEYWYVDLPKGLYWIYYFIRPYLLIKKYFIKPKKA